MDNDKFESHLMTSIFPIHPYDYGFNGKHIMVPGIMNIGLHAWIQDMWFILFLVLTNSTSVTEDMGWNFIFLIDF